MTLVTVAESNRMSCLKPHSLARGCREIQQLPTIRVSTFTQKLAVTGVTFASDGGQHTFAVAVFIKPADESRITTSNRCKSLTDRGFSPNAAA